MIKYITIQILVMLAHKTFATYAATAEAFVTEDVLTISNSMKCLVTISLLLFVSNQHCTDFMALI